MLHAICRPLLAAIVIVGSVCVHSGQAFAQVLTPVIGIVTGPDGTFDGVLRLVALSRGLVPIIIPVENGGLNIRLAPGSYVATYQDDLGNSWTEQWVVGVSVAPLTPEDVKVSQSQQPSNISPPSAGTIQISDVVGLSNALSQINSQLTALTTPATEGLPAVTTLSNLSIRLNEITQTVNTLTNDIESLTQKLAQAPTTIENSVSMHELPAGALNGQNTTFSLAHVPDANTLSIFKNGVKLQWGTDYTLTNNVLTLAVAPQISDWLSASYWHLGQ